LYLGIEIHQDFGEKSDEEKEPKDTKKEDAPAVDDNGRILFRKQDSNKSSTKRKLKSIIDQELTKKTPSKKKKKPKTSMLSFADEE
jgi:hypothetical protein